MNAMYLKIVSIGAVWTLAFLFTAQVVASMLCSTHRTYEDADGVFVTETTVAASEVVWSQMLSPLFAIPAAIVLVGGWFVVWYMIAGRQT